MQTIGSRVTVKACWFFYRWVMGKRGGQCAAISTRQKEVLAQLSERFPTITWNDEYKDPAQWAQLVPGKGSPILGTCGTCHVAVSARFDAQIRNGSDLMNCKCNSAMRPEKPSKKKQRKESTAQPSTLASSSSGTVASASAELWRPLQRKKNQFLMVTVTGQSGSLKQCLSLLDAFQIYHWTKSSAQNKDGAKLYIWKNHVPL